MINAGKYNKKISIFSRQEVKDGDGFKSYQEVTVLTAYANVKTTKGMTLITNNSDFEKVYTNFTIRYPKNILIYRKMFIRYNNRVYTIEYLNNINEENVELEIQAKEVMK